VAAGAGGLLKRLLGRSDAPGEPFLMEVRAGGGRFSRVVFTRNRRVMVSVGDGGDTLRVHQAFREAPVEVRRALGALYGARTAAARRHAKEVLRGFLSGVPPRRRAPRPPRPSRRRRAARPAPRWSSTA
jgi:hypothetical protein